MAPLSAYNDGWTNVNSSTYIEGFPQQCDVNKSNDKPYDPGCHWDQDNCGNKICWQLVSKLLDWCLQKILSKLSVLSKYDHDTRSLQQLHWQTVNSSLHYRDTVLAINASKVVLPSNLFSRFTLFKLFLLVFKKIDINGHGLFSLCAIRLYVPLDVEIWCCAWDKIPTTNLRIVWTKNSKNHHLLYKLQWITRISLTVKTWYLHVWR